MGNRRMERGLGTESRDRVETRQFEVLPESHSARGSRGQNP